MYEDSNGNRLLDPSEDLDGDGHFDCGEFTATITNPTVQGVDQNSDGKIVDVESDANNNGVLDDGEDVDGDGHFDLVCEDVNNNDIWDVKGPDNKDLDKKVNVYFDETEKKSKACYNQSIVDSLGTSCTNSKDLEEVAFLWSANNELSKLEPLTLGQNRSALISGDKQRNIITWNDIDRDGVVDDGEVVPFEKDNPHWEDLYKDFNAENSNEVDEVVDWIRGIDQIGLRSRLSLRSNGEKFYWRLGGVDQFNTADGDRPSGGISSAVSDASYIPFVAKYKTRRHVVYFGGNDGMLHAVNAGFYSGVKEILPDKIG